MNPEFRPIPEHWSEYSKEQAKKGITWFCNKHLHGIGLNCVPAAVKVYLSDYDLLMLNLLMDTLEKVESLQK